MIFETDTGNLYLDSDGTLVNGASAIQIARLELVPVMGWTGFLAL